MLPSCALSKFGSNYRLRREFLLGPARPSCQVRLPRNTTRANHTLRSGLIRLASFLPAGNPTRKAILAGLRSIPFEKEAAGDPGLRRALAAWKADGRMWEGQARMQGKSVLIKKMGWLKGTPDFSKLVDEINAMFFTGSGYHIEVTGSVTDKREPPNKDFSEKNFSYQEYLILPD